MEETQGKRFRLSGTFWRWLQLPVLIIVLLAGFLWLGFQQSQASLQMSHQQHDTALQVAHDQQQDALLQNYMDSISSMMINDKLFTATSTDIVKAVAQARTNTILPRLDGDHKALLMRFLYDTKLINNDHRIITMIDVDVSGAHLQNGDLRDTALLGINLSGSDLRGSNFSYAELINANLSGVNLAGADLHASDLHNVILTGANLTGANLKDSEGLTSAQLATAKTLSGATMPDGTVHP